MGGGPTRLPLLSANDVNVTIASLPDCPVSSRFFLYFRGTLTLIIGLYLLCLSLAPFLLFLYFYFALPSLLPVAEVRNARTMPRQFLSH